MAQRLAMFAATAGAAENMILADEPTKGLMCLDGRHWRMLQSRSDLGVTDHYFMMSFGGLVSLGGKLAGDERKGEWSEER